MLKNRKGAPAFSTSSETPPQRLGPRPKGHLLSFCSYTIPKHPETLETKPQDRSEGLMAETSGAGLESVLGSEPRVVPASTRFTREPSKGTHGLHQGLRLPRPAALTGSAREDQSDYMQLAPSGEPS